MRGDHYSVGLERNDEGWWLGECVCGWKGGIYPEAEDACDALMDHAFSQGILAAPVPDSTTGEPDAVNAMGTAWCDAARATVPGQNPTEGRSDEGDGGRDSPATRKCAGAEATSESVVPPSSEPSPATSSTTAYSGDPGSAATGRPYDPKLDHPERYGGNNPWRPIG